MTTETRHDADYTVIDKQPQNLVQVIGHVAGVRFCGELGFHLIDHVQKSAHKGKLEDQRHRH
jgi:hypothetical protein